MYACTVRGRQGSAARLFSSLLGDHSVAVVSRDRSQDRLADTDPARETAGRPRWITVLVVAVAVVAVAILVLLHLSGAVGPGVH
jgi:hypothetical protein